MIKKTFLHLSLGLAKLTITTSVIGFLSISAFSQGTQKMNTRDYYKEFNAWKDQTVADLLGADHSQHEVLGLLPAMKIAEDKKQRITKAVALCIDSFAFPEARARLAQPAVYSVRRQKRDGFAPLKLPKKLLKKLTNESLPSASLSEDSPESSDTFSILTGYAQKQAEKYSLDDWDKACMSKCIADIMLKSGKDDNVNIASMMYHYFHGFYSKPTDEILMEKNPACSNFARVTKGVAEVLGFAQKVSIKTSGLHTFNAFYIDHKWYHIHLLDFYGKWGRYHGYCNFFEYEEKGKGK